MPAGIDKTANADAVAHLEAADVFADRRNHAGNFVAGHLRHRLLFAPNAMRGMHVAMADAAITDFNGDIVIADRAALEGDFVQFAGIIAEGISFGRNKRLVIQAAIAAGRSGAVNTECAHQDAGSRQTLDENAALRADFIHRKDSL